MNHPNYQISCSGLSRMCPIGGRPATPYRDLAPPPAHNPIYYPPVPPGKCVFHPDPEELPTEFTYPPMGHTFPLYYRTPLATNNRPAKPPREKSVHRRERNLSKSRKSRDKSLSCEESIQEKLINTLREELCTLEALKQHINAFAQLIKAQEEQNECRSSVSSSSEEKPSKAAEREKTPEKCLCSNQNIRNPASIIQEMAIKALAEVERTVKDPLEAIENGQSEKEEKITSFAVNELAMRTLNAIEQRLRATEQTIERTICSIDEINRIRDSNSKKVAFGSSETDESYSWK